jgi:hypothetical protein
VCVEPIHAKEATMNGLNNGSQPWLMGHLDHGILASMEASSVAYK